MTRIDIESLLDRYFDAVSRRDAVALSAEHADACVMDSPTAGGVVTGRDAIAEVYGVWFRGFPDLTVTREDPIIDGARFAQSFTLTGTDTGGFLGLEPTRKPFRILIVIIGEVSDGKIVHARPIYDFSGMLIQIGVLKAKPAS
jgi:predicted ester cyclase